MANDNMQQQDSVEIETEVSSIPEDEISPDEIEEDGEEDGDDEDEDLEYDDFDDAADEL